MRQRSVNIMQDATSPNLLRKDQYNNVEMTKLESVVHYLVERGNYQWYHD